MKVNKHLKVAGDVKDRGRIKWQGLLLTEHVNLIKDWYAEADQDTKPELDEYDLLLIQEEMGIAFKRKCIIKIKSWKNKKFHYHIGTIGEMNAQSRSIVYEDPYGKHRLPVEEIVAVMMID